MKFNQELVHFIYFIAFHINKFWMIAPEVHLESSPLSKMELFSKIVYSWETLTIFAERPVLRCLSGFWILHLTFLITIVAGYMCSKESFCKSTNIKSKQMKYWNFLWNDRCPEKWEIFMIR